MTRLLRAALAASMILFASRVAAQTTAVQVAGAIQTLDCYQSLGTIDDPGKDDGFQTSGECQITCTAKGAKVMATSGGTTCYCGDTVPPPSAKVDGDQCNVPCSGYDKQTCGGVGTYQFYLTGLGAPKVDPETSSSTSNPSSASSSASSAANTVVATETASQSAESSGGGNNKVGIAVGVVISVIGVAAILGVGVFFYKRRRRLQLEEEHRRSAAVNGFVGGSKSETSSANDSRLDPSVYSHSRHSIGSIADERDFSRRILQVRNPDRESRASHV